MTQLVEASPLELRRRIAAIPSGEIEVPDQSPRFPNGVCRVDGDTLRHADMLLLIGGLRINEAATKTRRGHANTSHTLRMEATEHKDSGEEALLISCDALKKRVPETREFAVPLKPRHEPFAEPILEAWNDAGKKNYCSLSEHQAYLANRQIFSGLAYRIEQQVIYQKDEMGHVLRDPDNRRPLILRVIEPHPKQQSNHGLRHWRLEELEAAQLQDREITSYFKWSSMTMGINPMRTRYGAAKWHTYFAKLLKKVGTD